MKPMVYDRYGPPEVLCLGELPKPEPKAHEVLIRVRAASVNFGDLLARDGRYVYVSFKTKQLLEMVRTRLAGGQRVVRASETERPADLSTVKDLIERGRLATLIDRTFPLAQAAEAHRYVESGGKLGQVAITM
ncbi:MAG: zinc-binding dehydrogenase [Polyangiaceae bacterium]|nr:zinc-binding dehydrogenase [Polyangiaceae bacterium]